MRKLQKTAVLGGLVIAALVLLVSLPVMGDPPPTSPFVPFFRRAEHAFIRACTAVAIPDTCRVVVRTMFVISRTDGELNDGILREFARALNLPPGATCGQCVNATKDFEDFLTSNTTLHETVVALGGACSERYLNETWADQCRAFVGQLAEQAAHRLTDQLSPNAACTQLNYCPGP